ncbi:hypothetical protein CKALI_09485 [Corynebacterium kalinowskii]|uniref:Uncharacterized protein n=1 Tax=Corynebacterium kalinowskii TaxID=2675216 RepID=A0A6B8VC64_9CORY|nr:hypothetical protein [Corynebacterium kalinowskii]QGU02752.1 hypothetical protein CKALI_09485 [Corynebacterium kalinowskii]
MSLLHFDANIARELVRQTDHLTATIHPASAVTSNDDDFATALVDAIDRTNTQTRHLADYLQRVAENSSRVIAHAENHDAGLGHTLEAF